MTDPNCEKIEEEAYKKALEEFVTKPEDPELMRVFDWKNEELQKWAKKAIIMQGRHVSDNNKTKAFQCERTQLDSVQLRICMVLFGMKIPENGEQKNGKPTGTCSSMLKCYSWKERRKARNLQVKISNDCVDGKIQVNIIYVSVAFPSGNSFSASENAVFVLPESGKFMDAGGRVYADWKDYLRANNFSQGVMIYPDSGSYCPVQKDGKTPEEKVKLVASETHSCTWSERTKHVFDAVVATTGLALTAAALVTAVPLGIFAATTIASIQTGSFWIGVACTTYSVSMSGYDKLTHDESVRTEILLTMTTAFSVTSRILHQKIFQKMTADLAVKAAGGELWDDVVQGISRTNRWLFATINLIQLASSASSVLSAIYHLWLKENRTWLDYFQLCMSLFFFINVVAKPITLQGIFEAEQGKCIQNELRSQIQREESLKKFDETVKEHKSSQQKSYLIRSLKKLKEPLDEHFYRMHTTGINVQYTADGLVIDNRVTMSVEAYNELGMAQLKLKLRQMTNDDVDKMVKDYKLDDDTKERLCKLYNPGELTNKEKAKLRQELAKTSTRNLEKRVEELDEKLREIRQLPTPEERKAALDRLVQEGKYEGNMKELCNKFSSPEMTILKDQDKSALQQKLGEISKLRKDQLFEDIADSKKVKNYRESMVEMERKVNDGKTLDEWVMEKSELDKQLAAMQISQEEYDQKIPTVKQGIEKGQARKAVDNLVRGKETISEEVAKNDYGKSQADGKSKDQWEETKTKLEKKLSYYEEENPDLTDLHKEHREHIEKIRNDSNSTAKAKEIKTLKEQLNNAKKNLEAAERAEMHFDELNVAIKNELGENFLSDNRKVFAKMQNYADNERLVTFIQEDNLKMDIEHIFGVNDYKNVTISIYNAESGQMEELKIFKDMKLSDVDRLSRVLGEVSNDKQKFMEVAKKLVEDTTFPVKVKNPRDLADVIAAVKELSDDLRKNSGLSEAEILDRLLSGAATIPTPNGEINAYSKVLEDIRQVINEVDIVNQTLPDGQQMTSRLSAGAHVLKHAKSDLGEQATARDYLKDYAQSIIKPENELGTVHMQVGGRTRTYYGLSEQDARFDPSGTRLRFGVTVNNIDGSSTRLATVFQKDPGSRAASNPRIEDVNRNLQWIIDLDL